MFGWLTKRKREIFEYHDGTRVRHADPIVIMRDMALHPKLELDRHLKEMQSPELKLAIDASRIAVDATREIFRVPAWREDQPGLTELETIDLLNAFILYTDTVKKNGSGPPISPDASESPPSEESTTNVS